MITEIKAWLNEKGTYLAGVDLFLKCCPGHQLAELFTAEGESLFKMKKLQQELQNLVAQDPGPVQNITPSKPAISPAEKIPTLPPAQIGQQVVDQLQKQPGRWSDPAHMDAAEKDLHATWHPLFLEMNNLQARIYDVAKAGTTDGEQQKAAGIMAHRILNLAQQCKAIYKTRDAYFSTGQLPAPAVALAVDPQIAFLKLKNAERYVREFTAKLKAKPNDKKATEKLAHWQNIVSEYKTQLNIK